MGGRAPSTEAKGEMPINVCLRWPGGGAGDTSLVVSSPSSDTSTSEPVGASVSTGVSAVGLVLTSGASAGLALRSEDDPGAALTSGGGTE